jgi:hypothetical protein
MFEAHSQFSFLFSDSSFLIRLIIIVFLLLIVVVIVVPARIVHATVLVLAVVATLTLVHLFVLICLRGRAVLSAALRLLVILRIHILDEIHERFDDGRLVHLRERGARGKRGERKGRENGERGGREGGEREERGRGEGGERKEEGGGEDGAGARPGNTGFTDGGCWRAAIYQPRPGRPLPLPAHTRPANPTLQHGERQKPGAKRNCQKAMQNPLLY